MATATTTLAVNDKKRRSEVEEERGEVGEYEDK